MALIPLVAAGEPLTAAESLRYARHCVLPGIGDLGQRRLRAARVLVVGAGGLGSPVVMYLAAAGVGTIGIIDDDHVDESNLQRQVLHSQASVGRLKTESAAQRVAEINDGVTVIEHPVRLTSANAYDIIGGYDVVIDGADNFTTRYLVNDVCVALGKPDVLGSVLMFHGQVSVFWAEAGPCYRCIFPTPPTDAPSCADAGVFGALCGIVGSWMAAQAISIITGVGEPLVGRLMRVDADVMKVNSLAIGADSACQVCGSVARKPLVSPPLISVTARQVQTWLGERTQGTTAFRLIDIREPHEFAICAIAGAELIPQAQFIEQIPTMNRDERLIVFCRSGVRSANALNALIDAGFTNSAHMGGGILEWIAEVDSSQTPY